MPDDDALFFEYVWPPTEAELAEPDPIDDWDAGLVGFAVDDIRDLKKRVPLIELSNNLEQAKKQAAEIWRNRTGLDPSEDPPEGYAIWDARGTCQFSYYLSEVIRAEHGTNGGRGNGLQGRNRN